MWLEGGGEEDRAEVLKEGTLSHLSVCLLALGLQHWPAPPYSETV